MMQTGSKGASRGRDAAVAVEIVPGKIEDDGEDGSAYPHSSLEAGPAGEGTKVVTLADGSAPENTDDSDWPEDEPLDSGQGTRNCCKDGNAEPPPVTPIGREQKKQRDHQKEHREIPRHLECP